MEQTSEFTEPAPRPLREEIAEVILAGSPSALAEGDQRATACQLQADAVVALLAERGHYLPGAPPAAQILEDAKSFAERLTLALLALRLLRMLTTAVLENPETKGTLRWLNDYMDGRNHGPTGSPMLWPGGLPGLSAMLREWGFEPTPTRPQFVARSLPKPMGMMQ